jgi:hypothetical protein
MKRWNDELIQNATDSIGTDHHRNQIGIEETGDVSFVEFKPT